MDTTCSKTEFEVFIPFLPPSVNRAYTFAHNRKILTGTARTFKIKCFEALKHGGLPSINPDKALRLDLQFYVKNLENKGWPDKAKHRFKKRDVSNWIKLLEDVISKYVEVDDSSFVDVLARKRDANCNPKGEGVWITIKTLSL
jgi:Holliday junction resolvase RusA-like endonuclease